MRIAWEKPLYVSASSARLADVGGHRLYVYRAGPRQRTFLGSIDGVYVAGGWDTIDAAMAAVAVEFRSRHPEAVL